MSAVLTEQREVKGSFAYYKMQFHTHDLIILGTILIIFQLLDGAFTFCGVQKFGMESEGNLIMRQLMHWFGCFSGVAIAKLLTISVIAYIISNPSCLFWSKRVLVVLCFFYFWAAIVPWTYILVLA